MPSDDLKVTMEDAKQIKKIDQSLSAKKLIKTPAVVLVKEKTSTE